MIDGAQQVRLYLAGGASNTDPALSTGGVRSAARVPTTLFPNITDANNTAQGSRYRCLYIVNDSDTLVSDIHLWTHENTPYPLDGIAIGLGTSAVDGTEQTIANQNTAPTGVTFEFPTTGAYLVVGDLPPGASRAIWLRLSWEANGYVYQDNGFTVRWQGSVTPPLQIVNSPAIIIAENTTYIGALSGLGGLAPYSYSVVGGVDAAKFALSGANGYLFNFDTAPDYESPTDTNLDRVYEVTLRITDANNVTADKAFAITVGNANDVSPQVTAGQVFNIGENAVTGAVVGTVVATDQDPGTSFGTWTIASGNASGKFVINANSGQITTTGEVSLTVPQYVLGVTVSDGVNTSAEQSVTVNVTAATASGIQVVNVSPVAQLAGGASVTATLPAAVVAGNRVLVAVGMRYYAATGVPTDGITSVTMSGVTFANKPLNEGYSGDTSALLLWEGVVTSGGATQVSVGAIADCTGSFAVLQISGAPATPTYLNATGYAATEASLAVGPVPPSGTLASANGLALLLGDHNSYNVASVGWQTPSGWTQRAAENVNDGSKAAFHLCTKELTSSAAVSVTHTATNGAQYDRRTCVVTVN